MEGAAIKFCKFFKKRWLLIATAFYTFACKKIVSHVMLYLDLPELIYHSLLVLWSASSSLTSAVWTQLASHHPRPRFAWPARNHHTLTREIRTRNRSGLFMLTLLPTMLCLDHPLSSHYASFYYPIMLNFLPIMLIKISRNILMSYFLQYRCHLCSTDANTAAVATTTITCHHFRW